MAWHNDIGRWGEDVAANLLVQKGYKIEARNWKEGKLEVDIIAADSHNIVFVEVKTRATMFAGKLPEEKYTCCRHHKRKYYSRIGIDHAE